MLNFTKVMMASAGEESYWMASFHRSGQSIEAGSVQEINGKIVAGGYFQQRNYVAGLNASTGDLDFTFASKGRKTFVSSGDSALGRVGFATALYDPVHDVYAICGFYDGSTTGTNIDGQTVQFIIYDRDTSTSASQLNRTWGKDYYSGGATIDSFSFDSAGDLITGGLSNFGNGEVAMALLYDQSNTGYGAAYTPTKSIYLKNTTNNFHCYYGWVYLNSNEELIMVGGHNKSNGYTQYGVAKISGSTWNTLDFNKAYTFGNGNDNVYDVAYNEALDHVAILHNIDVDGNYMGVTLVDCSDGSVTNSFKVNGPYAGFNIGDVIALDSQWNVYIALQNFNFNEIPLLKINNANTTSRSMEWLLGLDNSVGGSTKVKYIHINENDVPIISFQGRNAGSGSLPAAYVLKMPSDGSAGSTSGTTYLQTTIYDRTAASGVNVSFTTKSPSTVTGSISLNSGFPDNLSNSNTSGIDELEDWEANSYETPV